MKALSKTSICCLPVAGKDNPYQHLMITGLNQHPSILAFNGVDNRFAGILITAIKHRPNYLHLDWITSYYWRRKRWMTLMNIPFFCLQIWLVRKILGVKLTWTVHNIQPHDSEGKLIHQFCRRFLAQHCYWIRIFSDQSRAEAAKELKQPDNKFRIVPEGSYVGWYPNESTMQEARTALSLPLNDKILLYLGLIKPYKGIIELIKAFKVLPPDGLKLVIVGRSMNKTYLAAIKTELTSKIELYDQFIEDKNLQLFFNAANLVVLPFQKIENSGSVILAMGFKKPIIAPAQGVLTKRLAQQDNLLYSDGKLKDKLKYALSLKTETLASIGVKNYKVLQQYDWKDFAYHFLK